MSIEVFCISLNSRIDRRESINKLFNNLNIKNINWWIVEKHPMGGRYGCFESHVGIWKSNIKCDYVMIFEDDVKIDKNINFQEIISEAKQLCDIYDTVHISNIPLKIGKQIKDNWYEGKFLTSLIYMAKKEKLKMLYEKSKQFFGIHVDLFLSRTSKQVGYICDNFYQNFDDTDNSWLDNIPFVSILNIEKYIKLNLNKDKNFLSKIPLWIYEVPIYINIFQHCLIKFIFKNRRI